MSKPSVADFFRNTWHAFRQLAKRALPGKADDENALLFKKIAWALVGMAGLMLFFAATVFFLSLRGQEETMVPKVTGKDLVTAILELQEKELVPVVQVRFSTDPRDKGNVVSQDPEGGLLSKAGRRVTLWISKGAVVNAVEDYKGLSINDLQLKLKTLFSSGTPLITIGASPMYVVNSAPEGTILEQQPAPGTSLSTPVELQLVVSRGPKGQTVKVGSYLGLIWTDAIAVLAADNIPFQVTVRAADPGEKPGTVVSQSPQATGELAKGAPASLTIAKPLAAMDGRSFYLLSTTLPEYPILVDIRVTLRKLSGDLQDLLVTKHPGGPLTLPYWGDVGDIIAVSVLDKEVFSEKVAAPPAP